MLILNYNISILSVYIIIRLKLYFLFKSIILNNYSAFYFINFIKLLILSLLVLINNNKLVKAKISSFFIIKKSKKVI